MSSQFSAAVLVAVILCSHCGVAIGGVAGNGQVGQGAPVAVSASAATSALQQVQPVASQLSPQLEAQAALAEPFLQEISPREQALQQAELEAEKVQEQQALINQQSQKIQEQQQQLQRDEALTQEQSQQLQQLQQQGQQQPQAQQQQQGGYAAAMPRVNQQVEVNGNGVVSDLPEHNELGAARNLVQQKGFFDFVKKHASAAYESASHAADHVADKVESVDWEGHAKDAGNHIKKGAEAVYHGGRKAVNYAGDKIDDVDWEGHAKTVGNHIKKGAEAVYHGGRKAVNYAGDKIDDVDWEGHAKTVGNHIKKGATAAYRGAGRAVNYAGDKLDDVDWERVGGHVVDGAKFVGRNAYAGAKLVAEGTQEGYNQPLGQADMPYPPGYHGPAGALDVTRGVSPRRIPGLTMFDAAVHVGHKAFGARGALGEPSPADVTCVLCQFWVQQVDASLEQYAYAMDTSMPSMVALEKASHAQHKDDDATSLLETDTMAAPSGAAKGVAAAGAKAGATAPMEKLKQKLQGPHLESPGHERATTALESRPNGMRGNPLIPPVGDFASEMARYQYSLMYNAAYQKFESTCVTRSPEPYNAVCERMMPVFPKVAQALHYGDRPEKVCTFLEFCGQDSYLAQTAHGMPVMKPLPVA